MVVLRADEKTDKLDGWMTDATTEKLDGWMDGYYIFNKLTTTGATLIK